MSTEHKGFGNKIGGLLCILVAVLSWVGISEIIPIINSKWNHGYFIRLFVSSSYIMFIIVWLIIRYILNKRDEITGKHESCDWWIIFKAAVVMNFLYVIDGYVWFISLWYTEASINNTICQTVVAVVYILSVVFLKMEIKIQKCISVVLSIAGVAIISLLGKQSKSNDITTSFGIIMTILCTLLWGVYQIIFSYLSIKYFNSNNVTQDTILFTGFMGIATILTCWPFLIILDFTNIEPFELPPTNIDWYGIIITSILDSLLSISILIGTSLTNPVFILMGTVFVIPVTVITDTIFHGFILTISDVIGASLIILGFILMEIDLSSFFKCSINSKTNPLLNKKSQKIQYGSLKNF